MSLVPPARQLKHTRSISVSAYRRDDGFWDLEAHLVDQKTRDFPLASGVRPKGMPVHDMTLCITIDSELTILAASAQSDATPYPGECERITPDYGQLVGLNLMRGFRRAVRERLGGVAGCTHLTELTAVLPTAAVQAFAGEVIGTGDAAPGEGRVPPAEERKPFQIDRCHALRSDGPAVSQYYPKWYRSAAPSRRDEESASEPRSNKESA